MNLLLDRAARPVIGHRGAAWYAPENTLASFRLALAMGAEALEFDIRRSADGEAMVFHDASLERTTEGTGPLAAQSGAELRRLDAGYRFLEPGTTEFSFRATGVGIPTLAEVIAEFPGVPLLIEIKEAAVAELVAAVLRAHDAAERAVVAGSDWQALHPFREGPFHLGASRRDIARLKFGLGEPDPACRCYAVPDQYFGLPIPTRRFVRRARQRESTVHVWTVDDARSALALWRAGANGMVSNKPDVIRAARDAAPELTHG